jgi:choline dehydrogenase-like flavoprotein
MPFFDAREFGGPAEITADVCIVGAGAAGITLARALAGQPLRVALLESGGPDFEHRPQFLYIGENVGLDSFATAHSRFRMFGGSTTRWGGQCRPLDPIDFERRRWIPHSGWPFDLAHLEPWYRRAQEVCHLGPCSYDLRDWVTNDRPSLPVDPDRLTPRIYQFSHPADFGRTYRAELEAAANVDVYLHANLLEIQVDDAVRRVTGLRLGTFTGKALRATARSYVLACGGIENARLLLASNRVASAGVGNQHDLVGRFFMDHPYFWMGYFDPARPAYNRGLHVIEDYARVGSHQRVHTAHTLPDQVIRQRSLNGCAIYMVRRPDYKSRPEYFAPGGRSLVHIVDVLKHTEVPDRRFGQHLRNVVGGHRDALRLLARQLAEIRNPQPRLALRAVLETTPQPDSRVTLGERKDRFGMQRVHVDWRVSAEDRRGLDRLRQVMGFEVERLGLGRLAGEVAENASGWPCSMTGGKHHMGTTRMHGDPRQGVVDPDCRVHDMANLYVAGSSVFPTGGYANPTLTIVALALRLADHLQERLRTPGAL